MIKLFVELVVSRPHTEPSQENANAPAPRRAQASQRNPEDDSARIDRLISLSSLQIFSERKLSSKGRISLRCRFRSEKRHISLRNAAMNLYLFISRYAILLILSTVIDMYDHLQQVKEATDGPCEVII